MANPVSIGTSAGGKPAFADFTVMLVAGRAVPDLFLRTATGQHIPFARFVVFETSGDIPTPKYELTFTDVVFSSFQTSGSSGDQIVHALSMAYAQVEVKVYLQSPNGGVTTESQAYRLIENKKK